jgi:hypothetical protein
VAQVRIASEAGRHTALRTLPEEVLKALADMLAETRFGSIEIVVHDGRVTQIERREKVRF